MNLFIPFWKILLFLFPVFVIWLIFFLANYDITKNSPISVNYDNNTNFVSTYIFILVAPVFSFLVVNYNSGNKDIDNQTRAEYAKLKQYILLFGIDLNLVLYLNKIEDFDRNKLNTVISMLISMPDIIFEHFKLRNNNNLYLSEKTTNRVVNLQFNIKYLFYHLFTKKEIVNLCKKLDDIFIQIGVIEGKQLGTQPKFLYISLIVIAFITNIINIIFSWANYSWILGTISIIFIIYILVVLIDGSRTIVPVFSLGTEGYDVINDLTKEITKELSGKTLFFDYLNKSL